MIDLSIDVETKSDVDLKSCGVFKYVSSPTFEIQLISYSLDDGDTVEQIDLTAGETAPQWFVDALTDPQYRKCAWNVPFERATLGKWFGVYIPPEQCFDDAILAAVCGLPLKLETAGKLLHLGENFAKRKGGTQLVHWFSKPCRVTKSCPDGWHSPADYPEKWELYKDYNRQDVVAEIAIHRLLCRWEPDSTERLAWCVDQRINERGIRIDTQLARNAVEINNRYTEHLVEEAIRLTGIDNPKSEKQVKEWLFESEGLEVQSIDKKSVAEVVARLKSDTAKQFMALRQEIAMASTKKFKAMIASAEEDDHARGCLQFYGAGRTGRWSGRRVQPQNMSKNKMPDIDCCRRFVKNLDYDGLEMLYGSPNSCLSELVRTTLIPEEGHRFIVCDYSAIEARVIAWVSGEQWRIDTFNNGGDIYCSSASQMFHVPCEKHGENAHLRQYGKIAELACIAEGSPVLTDHGLIPIERVTTNDMVWDGDAFVRHEGVIYKGERDVISYGGLTATPDHLVFVEGFAEAVPFYEAAFSGANLRRVGTPEQTGRDVCVSGVPVKVYDIRNAGRHHRFTVSNCLVHNCGYGGGVNALKAFGADKMGMTEEEMADNVDRWRAASPRICEFWRALETAAVKCVVHGGTTVSKVGSIRFTLEGPILWMHLPSGRRIAYYEPRYEASVWNPARRTLSYMGKHPKRSTWERLETWGGKMVENCVQAIARDCLRDVLIELDELGYQVVAHVHDEVIISEPIGGRGLADVAEIMGHVPAWAEGLPLRGDGYECNYYIKD